MTPQERIEEAHGLWELAVVRVVAMIEAYQSLPVAPPQRKFSDLLDEAIATERAAFKHWQTVSAEATK